MDPVFTNLAPQASIIGLYFSADYCRYCKEFTPMLVELYPQLLTNKIDIVLVSSDKSIDKYDSYRSAQPWPALPFDTHTLRSTLRTQYDIKTIPALLFFDAKQGTLIAANGRDMVRDNRSQVIKSLTESIMLQYDSDEDF